MQMFTVCQSGPGAFPDKRGHRLFYRRLRQSLINSKKRDFFHRNVSVANVLSDARIKVNILRGYPFVPRFEKRFLESCDVSRLIPHLPLLKRVHWSKCRGCLTSPWQKRNHGELRFYRKERRKASKN